MYLRRIALLIDSEIYETLNSKAWQRLWGMLPPDTIMRGIPQLEYGEDAVEIRLVSSEFDEVPVGMPAPHFAFSVQRPLGTEIETGLFSILAWDNTIPNWVRFSTVPSSVTPVSPAAVRALLNSRDSGIDLPTGFSVDFNALAQKPAKSRLDSCICDLAYTGMRHHKAGCPCK